MRDATLHCAEGLSSKLAQPRRSKWNPTVPGELLPTQTNAHHPCTRVQVVLRGKRLCCFRTCIRSRLAFERPLAWLGDSSQVRPAKCRDTSARSVSGNTVPELLQPTRLLPTKDSIQSRNARPTAKVTNHINGPQVRCLGTGGASSQYNEPWASYLSHMRLEEIPHNAAV